MHVFSYIGQLKINNCFVVIHEKIIIFTYLHEERVHLQGGGHYVSTGAKNVDLLWVL